MRGNVGSAVPSASVPSLKVPSLKVPSLVVLSLAVLLWAVPGLAADAVADEEPLTLAAAVQAALVVAPELTLARLDIEEAEMAVQEAELGQIVGQPERELEQATRALREARDAYADELVQIALQVEEAYYDVLRTADLLTIQRSNQEQADRQFELTAARFDAGLIARQDYLEAELNHEDSVHGLEAARRRHADAVRQLARLLGRSDEAAITLHDEFPFEPWHIDLDDALGEALAARAEIVRAERAVDEARRQVNEADSPFVAPVELRRARIGLQQAEIRLEQARNQVAADVRREWFALADIERNVTLAARQEQLAETRAAIAGARHEAGTTSLLTLLQDEAAYARARLDATEAVWDYNLAKARFLRTLGRAELPPLPAPIADYVAAWDD